MKILPIILLIFSLHANATTYYFSSTLGNDSRTSAQAQNSATPWQTIGKLNSFFSSLAPGDIIAFKSGDTFFGSIITNKSGTLSNKITFTSYGTGAKPVISGLVTVASWTNLGGGVYESNFLPAGSTVNMVLIAGKQYEVGRTPNWNASNGGYLTFESHSGSSITDNTNPFNSTYVGAKLSVRTTHSNIETATISGISGNTITYSGGFDNSLNNGYGYFVKSDIKTLDQYGEWYYNPSTHKLSVYFGSSGVTTTQVATQNILMTIENSFIVVNNLNLNGANQYGIYGTNSGVQNLVVKNCLINYCGIDGISLANRHDFILDSSTINYSNSCGISVGYQNLNPIVRNSTISNTATFGGLHIPDDRQRAGYGIYSNEGLTALRNNITNTGFIGINCEGSNNLMQYNFVDTFCTVTDDGGGLYMYNHNPTGNPGGAPVVTNNQILNNIVLHGIGSPSGTTETEKFAEGIYLDNNVTNIIVQDNTAAWCGDFGVYLHNDSAYNIRGNILYNNANAQIGFQRDATNPSFTFSNGQIKRNQLFYGPASPGRILYLASPQNNMFAFATMDSNYYCRPLNTNNIIQTNWFNNATNNYNLATWQAASGKDAHTVQSPVAITSTSDVKFLYNKTAVNKQFGLGAYAYKSVTGTTYSGTITLLPYTSIILLKTGISAGDTTITTYSYACDSSVTTIIPDSIYIAGYDTTVISDTSYNIFFDNQLYSTVDGSMTTIIPNYDTVPAHSYTFNCHNCGTCYRTDTIIRFDTAQYVYGMLPNASGFVLANRIHDVVVSTSNAYRDAYIIYNTPSWHVQQIRDSSLIVTQTLNFAQVGAPIDPFPTGSELTRKLNSFDSLLTAKSGQLPEFMFITNEEQNYNYWSGTVQQYIPWLNGCVSIAHAHGIPVGNGGILSDIVYYMRAVYKAEGKTDSANLLTTRGNLPIGVGTYQQTVIDWYSVEIAALSVPASQGGVDYVNVHWYEPFFFLPNTIDTTSGLLPLVVQFLRSRTGKPIVSDELGIGSNSQLLFNRLCDEFKNSGVWMMVYYDGDDTGSDPNSIRHPDWWKAWLSL